MKLAYLFDIDGTLLKVRHKANRQIIQQLLERFGISGIDVAELDFAGKTDRDIFSSLLENPSKNVFEEIKQAYLEELDRNLKKNDVHIFSGVHEVLDYLRNASSWVGLLTGNFAEAAKIKLSRTGLENNFRFGAYGDDHHDRNDLPANAFADLIAFSGQSFRPSDLIIIGDTPRDIECAHSFGAVAVAVSTGGYTYEELQAYRPDAVLSSMDEFPEWNEHHLKKVS